ncbi:MAG: WecB/TagA/CpsF family glycosyltransferase, partial [Verrucomicrobiota bacterium]
MKPTTTILGLPFYTGSLENALAALIKEGGLLVAPSGPGLATLPDAKAYHAALESSDIILTDSGLLVLLWNLGHRPRIPKLSGYLFFRELVKRPELRETGATFWIMPSERERDINLKWLNEEAGLNVRQNDCYVAPHYGEGELQDAKLLTLIEERKPRIVFNNIGGGVQERLGHALSKQLSFRPGIVCTGAAIAFFTGEQARIPAWVDRMHLGWLARIIAHPGRYLPRYT